MTTENNRSSFRETKQSVSLIPKLRFKEFEEEWGKSNFKSLVVEFRLGGNYANSDKITDKPLIKMGNLGRGNIKLNKLQYIIETEKVDVKDKINFGDLFFNTRNTLDLVGKVSIWRDELPLAYYNSNLMFLKFNNNFFMNYKLNSYQGIKALRRIATGTTSVAAIYTKDLLKIKLNIPKDEQEQQKIATFLTSVDTKIQQLTTKKQLLENYKKGVMQQLFSQQLRFKNDDGFGFPDWEEKKLGEVAYITTGSSNRVDSSLDGKYTFFDRSEDIRTSSIYLFDSEAIIVPGEGQKFTPKYFIGKFDLHQRSYAIMNFNNCVGKFIFYHIGFHTNYLLSQAVGSTVKSLRLPMFKKMKINFPSIKEQQKIANYLSAIDTKIENVQTQIAKTQAFKKGLLQGMFV
jgi:type I restriction enzyme S subunit